MYSETSMGEGLFGICNKILKLSLDFHNTGMGIIQYV